MSHKWIWFSFVLSFLSYIPLCLANPNAHSNSQIIEAIHAAKSGELVHAKILFEKTLREGNNSAKLYYNLGVVYYKLALYRKAKSAFLHLTRLNKLSGLAQYNLALIEIKQHNEEAAMNWLDKVITNKDQQKLHQLALSLKHKILKKPISITQVSTDNLYDVFPISRKARTKTRIKTEFGYNDNIAQYRYIRKNNEKSSGDNFLFLEIDGQIRINRHINIEASTFYMAYEKKSYFNTVNLQTIINYTNRIQSWNYKLDGGYIRQNSNGIDYRETAILSVSLFKSLSINLEYITTFNNDIIRILDPTYFHLGGRRYQWKHQIDFYHKASTYSFRYENEINKRNDYTSNDGLSFTSFSSNIHRAEFLISPKVNSTLKPIFFFGGEYLYYSKNNIIFGKKMDKREDIEYHYGLNVTYKIKKQTNLTAKYRYGKSQSTLNSYRYQNSLFQFGVVWSY